MYECVVYDCGRLQCTIAQYSSSNNFPPYLPDLTAQMLSIGGQRDLPAGSEAKEPCCTTGRPTMQCYLLVVGIIIIIIY